MADGSARRLAPEPGLRARLERLSIVSMRPHGHLHTGGRRSRATGSSIEFADHRAYSPGDDFRQIDWNIYARSNQLFVKVRESEETLVAHLLLDTSASMAAGRPSKLEVARDVLAALAWVAATRGDFVAGAVFGPGLGETFAPAQGVSAADRFLEFLSRQQAAGGTGLAEAARAYNAHRLPHGVAVLVSDLLSEDASDAVERLAEYGNELTVVHVLDPDFLSPGFAEEVELLDAEGGESVSAFVDGDLRDAYRRTVGRWREDLERFCHGRGVRYVPVESDWGVEDIVLGHLRQHRVLA